MTATGSRARAIGFADPGEREEHRSDGQAVDGGGVDRPRAERGGRRRPAPRTGGPGWAGVPSGRRESGERAGQREGADHDRPDDLGGQCCRGWSTSGAETAPPARTAASRPPRSANDGPGGRAAPARAAAPSELADAARGGPVPFGRWHADRWATIGTTGSLTAPPMAPPVATGAAAPRRRPRPARRASARCGWTPGPRPARRG